MYDLEIGCDHGNSAFTLYADGESDVSYNKKSYWVDIRSLDVAMRIAKDTKEGDLIKAALAKNDKESIAETLLSIYLTNADIKSIVIKIRNYGRQQKHKGHCERVKIIREALGA